MGSIESCENCLYCEERSNDDSFWLRCCRNPPVIDFKTEMAICDEQTVIIDGHFVDVAGSHYWAVFPVVYKDWWCGEWKEDR